MPASRWITRLTLAATLALAPSAAWAQAAPPQTPQKPPAKAPAKPPKPKKPPRPKYGFFQVSAPATGRHIGESLSYPLYGETATVLGTINVPSTPYIEGGLSIKLKPRLWVGGRAGFASGSATQTASFTIPHPLYFNQPRTANGSAPGKTTGLDLDLDLGFVIRATRTWTLEFAAGPAFTKQSQQVGTDAFELDETYPYTTLSISSAGSSVTHHTFSVGFHAGVRYVQKLNKRISFEGEIRFRRFTTSPLVQGSTQHFTNGGIRAGAGLRFAF